MRISRYIKKISNSCTPCCLTKVFTILKHFGNSSPNYYMILKNYSNTYYRVSK